MLMYFIFNAMRHEHLMNVSKITWAENRRSLININTNTNTIPSQHTTIAVQSVRHREWNNVNTHTINAPR